MKTYLFPEKKDWKALLQRPTFDTAPLQEKVKAVLKDIQQNGDAAVKKYTAQFDSVDITNTLVSTEEINNSIASLSQDLKDAIQIAANNIQKFHQKQVAEVEVIETMLGVQCWRKSIGIEKVGLYIPGGTAPYFLPY